MITDASLPRSGEGEADGDGDGDGNSVGDGDSTGIPVSQRAQISSLKDRRGMLSLPPEYPSLAAIRSHATSALSRHKTPVIRRWRWRW